MPRLIAILFFVIILIIQSGGSMLLMTGLQYHLKNKAHDKINAGLTSDQLVLIKAGEATSLHWTEDDEFQWQGIMFDVVYTEVHDGEVWYYCYQDEDETSLLAFWENYLHAQPQGEEDFGFITSMGWLFGSYLHAQAQVSLDLRPTILIRHYPSVDLLPLQLAYRPDTPPPQLS